MDERLQAALYARRINSFYGTAYKPDEILSMEVIALEEMIIAIDMLAGEGKRLYAKPT